MQLSVQIDTMRSKLIFYFWIFLITGEFGVGTAGMEGPSLILHSGKKGDQIFWKFEKWIIASCRENETPWCEIRLQTDEQINRPTFKGRLKIDDNGSLTINFTINNFSSKQAGLYTLQTINKSNKSNEKKFNVSVYPPKTANDSESSSYSECVCQCSVMNVTRVTLSWNPSSTGPFLEVEYQDTNGNCVVNNSVTDQTKQDCQCMSPDSGLDPGYIALICVLVVLVGGAAAAAAAVIYKRRKEGRNAVPGTMQEAEPLPVDTECAHRYEKKNGTVSSIKSRPDERRSLRINGEL